MVLIKYLENSNRGTITLLSCYILKLYILCETLIKRKEKIAFWDSHWMEKQKYDILVVEKK